MSRKKFSVLRNPKAAALAAVLLLATVQAAFAQRVQVYEGKLDGVWISVERLSTGQHMKLRPGSTLELEPGEQVLLRPFSPKDENPTGDRQYLSAEFSLTKGGENIEVVKHEPPYGRIFIEPRQNAGGKTATLHYRLLGKVQATRAGLASGTLTIEIARDARRSAPGRAEIYEGKVDEVRISVRRLDDDNERTQLRPGETLRLDPGEQVLLRPFSPRDGNPTGDRQYLSAEFTLERKGSVNIDVLESEHHYGRVVIEARRGGAGKAAALRYRLLDVNVARAGLTEDVIPIEIAGVAGVAPPVAPDAPRRGVTLYEDNNYRGENETFFEDRPDLRNSRIRNDRVSSIRIPEGCTVTLYRDVSYQGRISVLRSDVPELGRTEVGNDSVSSLKVDCR